MTKQSLAPVPTWRVLDSPESIPKWTGSIMFSCPRCGKEALLPIVGIVIAQTGDGALVFDPGDRAIPKVIQCRYCRRRFSGEDGDVR